MGAGRSDDTGTPRQGLGGAPGGDGMLTVMPANEAIRLAALRPDPVDLYRGLWYEGEVSCLFADSNAGKSLLAMQIAELIARDRNVLVVDCEHTDKQFQIRYTNPETGQCHVFPERLYRAEINPDSPYLADFESMILSQIEALAIRLDCRVIIIDNLTYLCNASDKGVDAGQFMIKLMNLKKKHGWSLMVIAHTPKRSPCNPITQNDLAGSKKLYNFFDSVFAIGKSAKDGQLRYVKQLKSRSGEILYGSDNVIVFELEKMDAFLGFRLKGYDRESAHLGGPVDGDADVIEENVKPLLDQGKSVREIAEALDISKSRAGRIVWKLKGQGTGPQEGRTEGGAP